MKSLQRVVIDGRVFATEAADRGMGRYVDHLAALLVAAGHQVILLVPPKMSISYSRPGVDTELTKFDLDMASWTAALNRLLVRHGATVYVDATPFLPPSRYDIYACPVVAVLYDLIPMRYPWDYFAPTDENGVSEYVNGLARVRKADRIVAISNYVVGHALRYLGISRDRVDVIEPGVHPNYEAFAKRTLPSTLTSGNIVCIQGAHRSKNFPAAIPFLERLSVAANCDVDIIVPTPAQRLRIEEVRNPRFSRVRVADSLAESRKFEMQRDARAIAHLSLDEGYGIPLAEALYLFRPVVCLDTGINREVVGCGDDPRSAGVCLLGDAQLKSEADVIAASAFIGIDHTREMSSRRREAVNSLIERQANIPVILARTLERAHASFSDWHSRAGLGIVAPTEVNSCGVSDYCLSLMRGRAPRYAMVLGPAPREIQLMSQLRLLPSELLDEARHRIPGVLLNLGISDSLSRAFDTIAESSSPADVLIIHDAGSYLPGLLCQAAERNDSRLIFERYLQGEDDDVREMSKRWLANPTGDPERNGPLFLELDRRFASKWLRGFRGELVSHHAAFGRKPIAEDGVLALLSRDSEIRNRARYVPMPIDARASPAAVRVADKMRWRLGLARQDLLVCCAGSIVRGKHLDVVARVVAALNAERRDRHAPGGITLLLAGRVLEEPLFAALRQEFAGADCSSRLLQIVESDETRYDALLLASDVVVAFREQRFIQMSHAYVRALALGRPMITNQQAGFDDADAAAVCRDDYLAQDLEMHLLAMRERLSMRLAYARASRSRYWSRHTVSAFFDGLKLLRHVASAI